MRGPPSPTLLTLGWLWHGITDTVKLHILVFGGGIRWVLKVVNHTLISAPGRRHCSDWANEQKFIRLSSQVPKSSSPGSHPSDPESFVNLKVRGRKRPVPPFTSYVKFLELHQRTFSLRGWGDDSLFSKVLAKQVWGPEFGSSAPIKEPWPPHMCPCIRTCNKQTKLNAKQLDLPVFIRQTIQKPGVWVTCETSQTAALSEVSYMLFSLKTVS